jgi:bifunctional non-homologous end joining protein LigD
MHAHFIEPMLLQPIGRLPEGSQWLYERKLDGYRAIAFKTGGKAYLRSRNDKDFTGRYPAIASALFALPDETVIDGEVVATDETANPHSTCYRIVDPRKPRFCTTSSTCWSLRGAMSRMSRCRSGVSSCTATSCRTCATQSANPQSLTPAWPI